MMTTVLLHGFLGQKYGRSFRLNIDTPYEAIEAIDAGCPGFRHEYESYPEYVFRVKIGEDYVPATKAQDYLSLKNGGKTISITPMLETAASGKGILTAIAGVVLFVLDVAVFHTGYLAGLGLSLALGGVAQLLAPPPVTNIDNKSSKTKASYQFGSIVNVVKEGGPFGLKYGNGWQGMTLISLGVINKDITQGSSASTPGDGGWGGLNAYSRHSIN